MIDVANGTYQLGQPELLNHHHKGLKHTNVHMWLITLESSSVCAESIHTVAALERLSERRDSIALLDSSACSTHKGSEGSEESRHLDSVEMKGREGGYVEDVSNDETLGSPTCPTFFLAPESSSKRPPRSKSIETQPPKK